MRDELKSAFILAAILALFTVVTKYYNPAIWKFVVGSGQTAAAPPAPTPPTPAVPAVPSGFAGFLQTFGPPSSEEEGVHAQRHPPLATKWVDYEPEHVRVAFVAADSGENPPRREWMAIAFLDSAEGRPISSTAAGERLRQRRARYNGASLNKPAF